MVSPSGCPDGAPCSHAEVEAEWPKGLRDVDRPYPIGGESTNQREHPGERGGIPRREVVVVVVVVCIVVAGLCPDKKKC